MHRHVVSASWSYTVGATWHLPLLVQGGCGLVCKPVGRQEGAEMNGTERIGVKQEKILHPLMSALLWNVIPFLLNEWQPLAAQLFACLLYTSTNTFAAPEASIKIALLSSLQTGQCNAHSPQSQLKHNDTQLQCCSYTALLIHEKKSGTTTVKNNYRTSKLSWSVKQNASNLAVLHAIVTGFALIDCVWKCTWFTKNLESWAHKKVVIQKTPYIVNGMSFAFFVCIFRIHSPIQCSHTANSTLECLMNDWLNVNIV